MALTLQQLQNLDLGYISGANLLQFCPAQLLLNQSAIGIDFNDSLLISQTEMISELSNQYDFTAEYLKLSTANPDTREQLVLKLTTIGTIINILGSMAGVNDQMQYWFKWYSDNIEKINKPVAHAPIEDYNDDRLHNIYHTQIVEPQNAAEAISNTYTFCILKGLNKAPKLELDTSYRSDSILSNKDIDFLVTPHGCWGEPHKACIENNIPLVVVDENTTCYSEGFTYPEVNGIIHVENYLECAGLISCMSAGVDYKTVL